MNYHGCAPLISVAPTTFTIAFCLAAVCADASLRKNVTMFAVLIWWLSIGESSYVTPLVLASTQFLRRPTVLKHALRNVRAAHGPAYVLTLAQAFAAQPTLLSAIAASSSLCAATFVRPDNVWEACVLPRRLTLGNCFALRKRVHALLMITSTAAATARCVSCHMA